jgi:imidazoleglycerol-phosphate dehydratase
MTTTRDSKQKARSRTATVERKSKETSVKITIDLDRAGNREIHTDLPFFSHMLDAFACHGRYSLTVHATGDIEVDPHHLIEDTGIVLGQAIYEALNGISGIQRAGNFTFPMDGTIVMVAIDICGRRNLTWNPVFGPHLVGHLDPNLFHEFFKALADGMRSTIHVHEFYGDNDHHVIEASFKAFARALREAIVPIDQEGALSTKGMFDD